MDTDESRQQCTQFQRYISRVLLQRWVTVRTVKRGKKRPQYTRTACMNYHDLSTNTLVIDGAPIATPSGFIKAYKKDGSDRDVNYIAKRFAQLESEADKIIDKIDGNIGKGSTTLERREVNTLRKFLFIVSYRNGHHSQQFVEERFDDATLQRIKEFQAEYGLGDIRSVWFFNLKNILDSEHWEVAGNPRIFVADRLDYQIEHNWFHLGFFCTPADSNFIFTGAMGVSEGSPIQDPILRLTLDTMFGESRYWTGAQSSTERTLCLSRSWALTPRLLVLLSNVGLAQNQLSLNGIPTEPPYNIQESYFHDLQKIQSAVTCNPPLSTAASYMLSAPIVTFTQEHHRLQREFEQENRLDGKNIDTRVKDLITFQITKLTEEQSIRVNALLLDHCGSNIVFVTAKSLREAVRRYARSARLDAREDRGVGIQILERKLAAEEAGQNKRPS